MNKKLGFKERSTDHEITSNLTRVYVPINPIFWIIPINPIKPIFSRFSPKNT
jgi:hypothetical protein